MKKGFSLIEVMISIGIMSIVTMGIMQITQQLTRQNKEMEVKFDMNQQLNLVSQVLQNSDICKANLAGKQIGDTLTSIQNGSTTVLSNICYMNNAWCVTSMSLIGAAGTGNIKISINQKLPQNKTYTKKINFLYELDATNKITKCIPTATAAITSSDTCAALNGVWSGSGSSGVCQNASLTLSGAGSGSGGLVNGDLVVTGNLDVYGWGSFDQGISMNGQVIVNNTVSANRVATADLVGDMLTVGSGGAFFNSDITLYNKSVNSTGGSFTTSSGSFTTNSGNFTTSSGTFKTLNGNVEIAVGNAYKPGGGSWLVYSDARLKKVKHNYEYSITELNKLSILVYEYRNAKGDHVGVIAQQIQKIMPEAVTKDSRGYLVVNHEYIWFALVNAIKEIDRQNKDILVRLKRLEEREWKQNM